MGWREVLRGLYVGTLVLTVAVYGGLIVAAFLGARG